MDKKEFSRARRRLGKTQTQMSQLLGCSIKTIQSFEQGLRKVPLHVERHLLFLLASINPNSQNKKRSCWKVKKCPLDMRRNCPAWEFQLGNLCWYINGTICNGEAQKDWEEKMIICRKCQVFQSLLPGL